METEEDGIGKGTKRRKISFIILKFLAYLIALENIGWKICAKDWRIVWKILRIKHPFTT